MQEDVIFPVLSDVSLVDARLRSLSLSTSFDNLAISIAARGAWLASRLGGRDEKPSAG